MFHTQRLKDILVDVGHIVDAACLFYDISRKSRTPVGVCGILPHMISLITLAGFHRSFKRIVNIVGSSLLVFIKALLKPRIVAHQVYHGDLLIGVFQFGEKSVGQILADIRIKVDIPPLPLLHDGSPHKHF